MEVNPVPPSISDEELELNICKALSLTEHKVKPDDLQAYHHLKKKELVIVKFKCRKLKRRVLANRKSLRNKLEDLRQLKFFGKFFISESMCHENHQLAYKCCQLKNTGKINFHSSDPPSSFSKLMEMDGGLKIFARKGGVRQNEWVCLEIGGLPYYIEVFLEIPHDAA